MKKSKLAPTPRLKAGTYSALDVLRYVRDLVRKEPRRMNMSRWLSGYRGRLTPDTSLSATSPLPQCGTVGCAAGWINVVTGHVASNRDNEAFVSPGDSALKHLQLDECEGAGAELNDLFANMWLQPDQVVSQLATLMQRHRSELKRATVIVKPERRAR